MFWRYKEYLQKFNERAYEKLQDMYFYNSVDPFGWFIFGGSVVAYIVTTDSVARKIPGYTRATRLVLLGGLLGVLAVRRQRRYARGCTCEGAC